MTAPQRLFAPSIAMNFFRPKTKKEQPESPPKGPPHLTAQALSRDIAIARVRIKLYLANTAANQSLLVTDIYHLLVARHTQEFDALMNKHGHNVAHTNTRYQKDLVALNRQTLDDLCGFLEYLQGAFTLSKVRKAVHKRPAAVRVVAPIAPDLCALDHAPDFIVDPISFEIFHEPVITPSGITYEKSVLATYLKSHGFRDPITKEVLTMELLVPNLAVKEAANKYLSDYGVL